MNVLLSTVFFAGSAVYVCLDKNTTETGMSHYLLGVAIYCIVCECSHRLNDIAVRTKENDKCTK